jgi:hypothetical protein
MKAKFVEHGNYLLKKKLNESRLLAVKSNGAHLECIAYSLSMITVMIAIGRFSCSVLPRLVYKCCLDGPVSSAIFEAI